MSDLAAADTVFRSAQPADTEACIDIWVAACTARDGRAVVGVADRARPKFDDSVAWFVAARGDVIDGFALATAPGTGVSTDPDGAAILSLLAVAPGLQHRGAGRSLLTAATERLAHLGYGQAALHALVDNAAAVGLYESEGWVAVGAEYEHSLLKRPLRTFVRPL